MSKYIGISVGYRLAEEIKKSLGLDDPDSKITIIWQDMEYLVLEMDEAYEVPEILSSLDHPYLELSERELKNSPAEILEYLDAVRWMRIPGKKHRSKEHLAESSSYTALVFGEIYGVREFLLKGRKGLEASKSAMSEFGERFCELSGALHELIANSGGRAYFSGGMVEWFLPITNEKHLVFEICEKLKKAYESSEMAEVMNGTPKFRQMIYLFPSELPFSQAKREAEALLEKLLQRNKQTGEEDQNIITLYVDRRMGQPMEFQILESRLPNLDKRILFTCRSISHGADYMQLLSRSMYNKSLLMYSRFLNHECQPEKKG